MVNKGSISLIGTMLVVLICKPLFAENTIPENLVGKWEGVISEFTGDQGKSFDVLLELKNDAITESLKGDSGEWVPIQRETNTYLVGGQNIIFEWINQSNSWSETQIFSMSLTNDTLDIQWLRHLNTLAEVKPNKKSIAPQGPSALVPKIFIFQGHGILTRQ